MQHILEQCRKFGLGLVIASQSDRNLPEQLRKALGNVGTTIIFRLGRGDAEDAARRIGTTDPLQVKHLGAERAAHPLYTSLHEQWEAWTTAIQRLSPRSAFLHRRNGSVAAIRTPDLPDPIVAAERLAAIENDYLTRWFEVQPVIEGELANLRPLVPLPTTRRRKIITSSR